MKNILFIVLSILTVSTSISQTDVTLQINHKLGNDDFQFNTIHNNNLGQTFKVSRLQYYVTKISIVYDGNQTLAVSDDTLALINASDGNFSTIPLGNLNVPNIEAIKFHIGVFSPVNNEDPSLYPPSHPLAPKSPSMHWGWASGYRFLVYEGYGGTNFAQKFEFHALGNSNYFEVEVPVSGQQYMGGTYISIDGDYIKGVKNVDVSSGILAHGVDLSDLDVLINFRDIVFSASPGILSASSNENEKYISIHPNPSTAGVFNITKFTTNDYSIAVNDALGQEVLHFNNSDIQTFHLAQPGIYFVNITNGNNIVQIEKVVVN